MGSDGYGTIADKRMKSELAFYVNQLQRLHGQPLLTDAYEPRPLDLVLISATESNGEWIVDIDKAKSKAQSVSGGFPFADLQVFLPDQSTPVLECRLENARDGNQVPLDQVIST